MEVETSSMAVLSSDKRMKSFMENLRSDAKSLKRVKASTQAYKEGKTTTLTDTVNYVRAHRPSGDGLAAPAPAIRMHAARKNNQERVLELVD